MPKLTILLVMNQNWWLLILFPLYFKVLNLMTGIAAVWAPGPLVLSIATGGSPIAGWLMMEKPVEMEN